MSNLNVNQSIKPKRSNFSQVIRKMIIIFLFIALVVVGVFVFTSRAWIANAIGGISSPQSDEELVAGPLSEPAIVPVVGATESIPPTEEVTFAILADYGSGNPRAEAVADLVLSWEPDFIITLGDNNYPTGAADFIDTAVGQFFHSYISPYNGEHGQGSDVNRFFPALGNHDLLTAEGQPYLDYFTLPGNERYYDYVQGPVHFFVLNNNKREPDGVDIDSIQANWLMEALAASTSPWNIVYMHYPPYSSGIQGSTERAQWPYKEWGADIVFAGHEHSYERLEVDGLPYIVSGLGGSGKYEFEHILPESLFRYNLEYGAIRAEASSDRLYFEFINRLDEVIDTFEMKR